MAQLTIYYRGREERKRRGKGRERGEGLVSKATTSQYETSLAVFESWAVRAPLTPVIRSNVISITFTTSWRIKPKVL
jgi:hypothetical protein